jgi:hypothetical protein
MTNPTNKKTKEQFVSQVPTFLGIQITGDYINTDTKIEYKCAHGTNLSLPWQIKKMKNCCRTGYYESGKMWESNILSLEEVRAWAMATRKDIDVSETFFDYDAGYKRLRNVKCNKHVTYYDSRVSTKKVGQCPECYKIENLERLKLAQVAAWESQSSGSFVSKNETKWLDELAIKGRQVWLKDVKYKVDGFDTETNTVYLYHGKFWHGCPKTFDPEMIHPVVKLPMKELYEKTIMYENKIKEAGYNLIVKWGT